MSLKKDALKQLRSNPSYRAALGRAKNINERKAIASLVEGLVNAVGEILDPLLEQARSDPELAARLAEALNVGGGVLSNEPAMSGSNG